MLLDLFAVTERLRMKMIYFYQIRWTGGSEELWSSDKPTEPNCIEDLFPDLLFRNEVSACQK